MRQLRTGSIRQLAVCTASRSVSRPRLDLRQPAVQLFGNRRRQRVGGASRRMWHIDCRGYRGDIGGRLGFALAHQPRADLAPECRGTEGGFLQNPVDVTSNVPFNPVTLTGSLITGLAERWDMLIDFSAFAGKSLILYNDAPAPYPVGDPRNDYFPLLNVKGNPVNAATLPGQGPNTREIMRFDVGMSVTSPGAPDIPVTTDLRAGIDPFLAPIMGGIPTPPGGIQTRQLTLNETFDAFGRLIQLEGTNVPGLVKNSFGRAYEDAPTETPRAGATEIWEIANLTGDTHPIHFHLVNVQILNRQPFKVNQYNGTPSFLGPALPPASSCSRRVLRMARPSNGRSRTTRNLQRC